MGIIIRYRRGQVLTMRSRPSGPSLPVQRRPEPPSPARHRARRSDVAKTDAAALAHVSRETRGEVGPDPPSLSSKDSGSNVAQVRSRQARPPRIAQRPRVPAEQCGAASRHAQTPRGPTCPTSSGGGSGGSQESGSRHARRSCPSRSTSPESQNRREGLDRSPSRRPVGVIHAAVVDPVQSSDH